jgi:hypothetical protein
LKDVTTLRVLVINDTAVTNLSALKRLPLRTLRMARAKVSDLSPLKGMPLKELWIDYQPGRDAAVLRSFKELERINDVPAAEFWKAHHK